MIRNTFVGFFISEDIDRFGIDYLLQELPSDQNIFPKIAEKRKL